MFAKTILNELLEMQIFHESFFFRSRHAEEFCEKVFPVQNLKVLDHPLPVGELAPAERTIRFRLLRRVHQDVLKKGK
jgi:hypothetical protein